MNDFIFWLEISALFVLFNFLVGWLVLLPVKHVKNNGLLLFVGSLFTTTIYGLIKSGGNTSLWGFVLLAIIAWLVFKNRDEKIISYTYSFDKSKLLNIFIQFLGFTIIFSVAYFSVFGLNNQPSAPDLDTAFYADLSQQLSNSGFEIYSRTEKLFSAQNTTLPMFRFFVHWQAAGVLQFFNVSPLVVNRVVVVTFWMFLSWLLLSEVLGNIQSNLLLVLTLLLPCFYLPFFADVKILSGLLNTFYIPALQLAPEFFIALSVVVYASRHQYSLAVLIAATGALINPILAIVYFPVAVFWSIEKKISFQVLLLFIPYLFWGIMNGLWGSASWSGAGLASFLAEQPIDLILRKALVFTALLPFKLIVGLLPAFILLFSVYPKIVWHKYIFVASMAGYVATIFFIAHPDSVNIIIDVFFPIIYAVAIFYAWLRNSKRTILIVFIFLPLSVYALFMRNHQVPEIGANSEISADFAKAVDAIIKKSGTKTILVLADNYTKSVQLPHAYWSDYYCPFPQFSMLPNPLQRVSISLPVGINTLPMPHRFYAHKWCNDGLFYQWLQKHQIDTLMAVRAIATQTNTRYLLTDMPRNRLKNYIELKTSKIIVNDNKYFLYEL